MSVESKVDGLDRTWVVVGGLVGLLVLLCLLVAFTGTGSAAAEDGKDQADLPESKILHSIDKKLGLLLSRPSTGSWPSEVTKDLDQIRNLLDSKNPTAPLSRDGEREILETVALHLGLPLGAPMDRKKTLPRITQMIDRLKNAEKRLVKRDGTEDPVPTPQPNREEPKSRQVALERLVRPLARKMGIQQTVPREGELVHRSLEELLREVISDLESPLKAMEKAEQRTRSDLERIGRESGMTRKELQDERLLYRIIQRVKTLIDVEYRQSIWEEEIRQLKAQIQELERKTEEEESKSQGAAEEQPGSGD